MFNNHTDLNKACPKFFCPLSNIDKLWKLNLNML